MGINFAEVIAQVKKAHGWKGKDLAKVLDVDPSTVSKWVRGQWNPNKEAAETLLEMYHESMGPFDAPPEAPENLDPLAKKYCEEDEKALSDLEPTAIERLNPSDLLGINQQPIQDGYTKFLENLRFFMKDSRWDTDEKLETYLNLGQGYISEFGNHGDRFEELKIIGVICDLVGVPWSVLAFSNVAKEEQYARMRFKLQKMEEEMEALRVKAYALGSELGYISESNDEIPKS